MPSWTFWIRPLLELAPQMSFETFRKWTGFSSKSLTVNLGNETSRVEKCSRASHRKPRHWPAETLQQFRLLRTLYLEIQRPSKDTWRERLFYCEGLRDCVAPVAEGTANFQGFQTEHKSLRNISLLMFTGAMKSYIIQSIYWISATIISNKWQNLLFS